MNHALTRKLALAIDRMPAFPNSVRKILDLTGNINCQPKELIQVIDTDPVLTLHLLKVVNSAYYGLATRITSVGHAVVFLGFNTVKNLALSVAAIGMLPTKNEADFDVQQYLAHSLATAAIAKKLAAPLADCNGGDSFMAGLLHDFGKIVLAQFMPMELRLALDLSAEHTLSLHLALRKIVGVDHAQIGAELIDKWNFPLDLVNTIRYQNDPASHDTAMTACVFAANQISKKLGLGFAGNACIEPLPPAIAMRLGGDLDELITRLGNLDSLTQESKAFVHFVTYSLSG